MTCKKCSNQTGFTLIEIVVTIVIVAIFASVVIVFFGSSITQSSAPILRLQKSSDLQKVIANITADYKKYPLWRSSTHRYGDFVVPTFYNVIGQRFYYMCTTPAQGAGTATSGGSEPMWKGCINSNENITIPDGAVVWTCQGPTITLDSLRNKINSTGYNCDQNGNCNQTGYSVIENNFIRFDASNNELNGTNIDFLKVTIRNDNGEVLSAIFY